MKGKTLIKLSELDAKIIKFLLNDGRTSCDELAKACNVTRNVAWKHCKSMKKKGIIKGATVQINFGHFGFDALATLLISINAQQIDEVMEFIGKITEVRAYRQYNSVYNVRAITTLRYLNELDHIKQLIKQKLPIMGLKTYIWTSVRNIPENLNFTGVLKCPDDGKQQNSKKPKEIPKDKTEIDELDRQIMTKLSIDGRASFTQIAKQIGISTDTVVKRYHKLRNSRALKVTIQINPNKIGYAAILDFNIAFMSPGGLSPKVVESLVEIPDIIIITQTSGEYDLQVTAMIRDISELFAIQDQIVRICGVTKIEATARKIPDKWPTPQQYISTF